MMGGDAGISAFPDGDNIFQWTGTITGGAGTVRHPSEQRVQIGLDFTPALLRNFPHAGLRGARI
jgi:hypothetical protein